MTEARDGAEAEASAAEMLRLLRWLARSGARIGEEREASVRIVRAGPSGLATVGELGRGVWAQAVSMGFVAPEPASDEWRVTRKGRLHLKRLLSRCGGPAISRTAASAPAAAMAPSRRPQVDPAESPLAWLRCRKDKGGAAMIGDAEFQAGERLRADFWFAELTPRVTTNWSAVGGNGRAGPGLGLELRDSVVAARERVHRALPRSGPNSRACSSTSAVTSRGSNTRSGKRAGRRGRARSCCSSRFRGSRATTA